MTTTNKKDENIENIIENTVIKFAHPLTREKIVDMFSYINNNLPYYVEYTSHFNEGFDKEGEHKIKDYYILGGVSKSYITNIKFSCDLYPRKSPGLTVNKMSLLPSSFKRSDEEIGIWASLHKLIPEYFKQLKPKSI